jgi:hypothetical protein
VRAPRGAPDQRDRAQRGARATGQLDGVAARPPVRRRPRDALRPYGDLPLLHRDPFDRLLVAQAQVEDLTIVTGDVAIAAYGISVLPN